MGQSLGNQPGLISKPTVSTSTNQSLSLLCPRPRLLYSELPKSRGLSGAFNGLTPTTCTDYMHEAPAWPRCSVICQRLPPFGYALSGSHTCRAPSYDGSLIVIPSPHPITIPDNKQASLDALHRTTPMSIPCHRQGYDLRHTSRLAR